MSRYLEEAAELLRKAAKTNETDNEDYPGLLVEGRERIAQKFATLAAIDKGLLPVEISQDVIESVINDRA
ncbi:hypothetical protein [Streptomyces sp. NPDC059786]|uniref:hypothetical protein n=1 Tax=Streptomyces sp. NPDC059786 TaxID=3346946 RepID=UPI003665ABE2